MGINPAALSANMASGASTNTPNATNLAVPGTGLAMGMNMGLGSANPANAALAAPNANLTSLMQPNQLQHSQLQSQTHQLPLANPQTPHSQLTANSAINFNLMSFSREQLAQLTQSLSPQERHILQSRMMLAAQQQQQQQLQLQQMAQATLGQQLPQPQLGLGAAGMNSNITSGSAYPSGDSLNTLANQQRINPALSSSFQHPNQQPHPHQPNVGPYYERERSASSASSHHPSHGQPQGQNQTHQGHHIVQNPSANPNAGQGHQSQNQHHSTPQSMSGNAQAMMPPPPRPSTAQSQTGPSHMSAGSSRPGTAQSHRSPSREQFTREFSAGLSGVGSMNGFVGKPPTPQIPQSMQMSSQHLFPGQTQQVNAFPQPPGGNAGTGMGGQLPMGFPGQPQGQGQPSFPPQGRMSSPVPGSPYRGAKRKAGMESPRIGSMGMGMNMGMGGLAGVTGMAGMGGLGMGGMNMGVGVGGTGAGNTGAIMGPPGLPRQLSNPPDQQQINGYPLHQQQTTQPQQHNMSGAPISHPSQGMMGMGSGMPNLGVSSAASGMGMMGVTTGGGSMISHQRQTSLGPQTPVVGFPGLQHPQQSHSQLPMQLQQQQQQAQQQLQLQQHAQAASHLAMLGPKGHEMAMGLAMPKVAGGGDVRTGHRMPSSVPTSMPPGATGVPPNSDAVMNGAPTLQAPPPPPGLTLPSGITLNPAVTRLTTVPLTEAAEAIPSLSTETIRSVQGWMQADRAYDGVWRRTRERMAEEMREVRGKRPPWWERDPEGMGMMPRRRRDGFDVRYPRTQRDRDRDARDKRKVGRREGLKL